MMMMKKYILFMMLTLSAMLISCNSEKEEEQQPKKKKAPLVSVEPAMKTKMVSYVEITGTIQPNIFTDIKSSADGILESLRARENQTVEKDDIIAVINPSDRMAVISNNQLKVDLLEEKVKEADNNSEKHEKLIQELDKAKSNLEYAKNMYQTIPVICPMSGLVTQRWLDEGSQVSDQENIITISDMSSLVIKAEVNEKYFEAIKQGKKLPVILNAYPNDTLTGKISLVYPQVDQVTRSVKFDIKILNFDKTLLPGMMASVKIPVSVRENAVSAPEHAVLSSPDDKYFLFVVNEDSLAQKRIVHTGISSGNKIEIIKGLEENEIVVVSGQEMLKDSIKVKIMGTSRAEKK